MSRWPLKALSKNIAQCTCNIPPSPPPRRLRLRLFFLLFTCFLFPRLYEFPVLRDMLVQKQCCLIATESAHNGSLIGITPLPVNEQEQGKKNAD